MSKCRVGYVDSDGIRHSVELEAQSLYEAAILALKVFKEHELEPQGLAKLEVEIFTSVTHEVTVHQVKKWLDKPPRSPKDVIEKQKLKELLGE